MDIRDELRKGKNIYELPLRVCYYARVSTEHYEQASSIVNQVDYFVNYIKGISNWELVGGYVDEGISGKEVRKRENFIRMISDSDKNIFDLVLTKSVSRFARNTIDSIYYTNYLLDRGIGVVFINDNINTFCSDSEFRLTLMASIAQDELRKLSESVKFGLKQSINRGVVLGSSNILGYCKDRGKLVIVEEEAVIVRKIFNLFSGGIYNYSRVARIINDKHNTKFNSSSIKRILTNYKYKGFYCGKKSEVINYKINKRRIIDKDKWIVYRDYDSIPPIISEDIWDFVNDIIDKSKNTYREIYNNKVFCNCHGEVYFRRKKYKSKYYGYYICNKCFRISSKLLDNIIKGNNIDKIIVSNNDILRIDVKFKNKKNIKVK